MGMRYRGRTKGKNAWLNYSWSKRGLNVSMSAKAGPFTWNSGNKRYKSRVTTNLPGGLYHVSYGKGKRAADRPSTTGHSSDSGDAAGIFTVIVFFCGLFGLFLAFSFYFWWTIAALVIAAVLIGIYKLGARQKGDSLIRDFENASEEDQQSILDLAETAETDPDSVRSFFRTNMQASEQDIDDALRQLKILRKKYASL